MNIFGLFASFRSFWALKNDLKFKIFIEKACHTILMYRQKIYIYDRGHFDNQEHNFNFGQKNAYHKVFINENCMICHFFHKQEQKFEVKNV